MENVLLLTFYVLLGLCRCIDYNDEANLTTYDYIIVGGGSTGSVVANRLSEDGIHSVLVLEQGGKPPIISEVPLYAPLLHETVMEWKNVSEPQENACQGSPGGRCTWSRFRALGGCSNHNLMCWVRGNRRDFDNWEQMGAKGWNYKNVLEVFKKTENHTDEKIRYNGYHGTSGYQTVSALRYKTKAGEAFIEGVKYLGYQFLDDYNGKTQQGVGYLQVNQRDGLRCGAEKAFLRPAAGRPNLDILTFAVVRNVTFDNQKRANGVWYDHRGETKRVFARKEVVLSAGTISTPLVLMRSGIGPKEELEKFQIPVVVELPGVGQNLQDHPFFSFLNYVVNEPVGIVQKRDVNETSVAELLQGSGPLTSPGHVEGVAFMNTAYQNHTEEWPDILVYGGAGVIMSEQDASLYDKDAVGNAFILLHPKSRGYVKMSSADPYQDPIVNQRYFTHSEDIKRLIDGTRKIMSIYEAPAMKRYNPVLTPKVLEGCEQFTPDSDQYIECALRRYVFGGFHMAGTCRMGNPADKDTVVDPELRVKGVSGLRIADASIMPQITSGNLNAVCVMIGRKAADMMLSEEA